jgi:hypothetical protein
MEEIKAPKKERKFLKAVGNIAKVLANELVMGIGRKFIGKAIDKVGKKRQGLVIAFVMVAGISYASIDSIPYPITGNKQRLGFQTTGNGLVWRGTAADTVTKPTSYADKNIKAYLILDSVSGSLYVFKQGAWAISEGSTIDTVSLSNRINLKVNISDTAAMLLPYFKDSDTSLLNLISRFELKLNISDTASMLANYATKEYADTTGRLYARQDFTNVSTSTLTWTQTDTLIPGVVTVVQVYRNGQILLPSQYTIPTSTSVIIAATSFKVGDNYTVIFPRGGGAGSGSGSGSLTSISAGTGIVVSPNPITTTGTVSADLTVMMELTDTTLLNLTTRFASKLNTTDTASLSARIDTKGSGTVTSVASGYGITGGTITTTGTLLLDSAVVFSQIRDSIVDVAIGNDTIKILKQEYAPATTSVLTWTVTPKFPIQLKQYILVFRNGQLLINDQYNLTDTNQITIVSNSFKLGSNYTVVTVSGIGSVGTGVFPNPVYPDAGIALSTGTTWASSIPNNSTNWNTAFTDRLKWDGGSTGLVAATGRTSLGGTTIGQSMFTLTNPSAITFPRFNADNTVTARTAANFRSDIGAGTVTSVNIASGTPMSITNNTTTPEISMAAATGSVNGYLTSTDWTTFNGKQNALTFTTPLVNTSNTITINQSSGSANGFLTSTDWTTFNNKQNALSNASASVSGILTSTDWTTFNNKQNALSNASASVSGILTSTDWTTFNNKQNALSNASASVSGILTSTDWTTFNNKQNALSNASASVSGILTSTDWTTFNNKQNALTFTTPLVNTSNTITINQSSGSANGFLTSTDWTTFNNKQNALSNASASVSGILTSTDWTTFNGKQNALTLTTTGTSGAATLVGSTLNIPEYTGGSGTVTNVSGTGAISVINPTTTPVISVATAAFGTAGIVSSSGTQQFSGDKVFEGISQFNGRALFKDYTYVATRLAGLSSTDRFATVTIGSGLSLSSGTLSATGGGVTSVTASSPLSSTGGVTPNITITDAGAAASGVVNTTTQSFAGNKTFTGTLDVSSTGTFGGRVKTNWLERNYAYSTSSSFTVSVNTTWQDINTSVLTTITLPNAATYPGKELHLRQTGAGSVQSASFNIIPFLVAPTGSTSNGILIPSGDVRAATLVSDGDNWIIMQRNN